MNTQNLTAKQQIQIKTSKAKVWEGLTNPKLIKQYLFGSETICDWKEGSSIIYQYEWEGKKFEDKGEIKKIVPEKLLQYTQLSGMSGKDDKPENYLLVTYNLSEENGRTTIAVTQDNCKSEEEQKHAEQNWKMILESLRKLLED